MTDVDDCAPLLEDAAPLWQLGDPYPDDWVEVPQSWIAVRNPRRGRPEAIAESIRENGWFGRLTVQAYSPRQRGPRIIVGNHRYKAGLLLAMSRFPIEVVDVDDLHGDRALVMDNRASDIADWVDPELLDVLDEFQALEMLPGSGFTDIDVEALRASLQDPDPPPERPPSPDGVPVKIGNFLSFYADNDSASRFMDELEGEVGANVEDQIAECRRRLRL